MSHDLPPVDPDAPLPTHYLFCKTPGCTEMIVEGFESEGSLCPRCRGEFHSFRLESLLEADYIPLDDLIRSN